MKFTRISLLILGLLYFVQLSSSTQHTHPSHANLINTTTYPNTSNSSFTISSSNSLLSSLPSLPKLNLLNSDRFALPCLSQISKRRGWCMDGEEQCSSKGLIPDGSCSILKSKLCCVPPVTCGAEIDLRTSNGTFLTNPAYPQRIQFPMLCEIRLRISHDKKRDKLSHIKLEILNLDLALPSFPTGFCEHDALFISGLGYNQLPRLCGRVTGQHLLFNLRKSIENGSKSMTENRELKLRFVLTHHQWSRKWLLRIWTLADDHPFIPDHRDCMQQYHKPEDEIKSLNYGGGGGVNGVSLHGWQYGVCVKLVPGYCGLRLESNHFQLKPTQTTTVGRYRRESINSTTNQSMNKLNEITVDQTTMITPVDSIESVHDQEMLVPTTQSSPVFKNESHHLIEDNHQLRATYRPATFVKTPKMQSLFKSDSGCRFDEDFVQVPPSFNVNSIQCGNEFNQGRPLITQTAPHMLYISHLGRQHGTGFAIRYTQLFCP